MSLWTELRRRNVFKVAAAYLVASWLIIQIVGQLIDPLGLPDSLDTVVIVLLGIGLPVALVVAWIYEVTPDGIKVTSERDATAAPQTRSGQRLTYVVIALLVAAVGLMALDTYVLTGAGTGSVADGAVRAGGSVDGPKPAEPESAPADETDEAPPPAPMLAVLPFDDRSETGDQSYLADGIAAEIRSSLSLVDGLRVLGPDTSTFLKEQNADTATMRDDWSVQYALTGDVRRADDRIRIGITLTDTGSGTIAHADTYERMLDDYFALQDQIAEVVAQAMEVTLGVGQIGGRLGMTRDARAFEAYLRAGEISPLNTASIRAVLGHLERAVAIDDTFSLAWLALHNQSLALDGSLRRQGGDPAALRRAEEALRRVTELTPNLPELHLAGLLSEQMTDLDLFELERILETFSASAAELDYPLAEILLLRGMFLYATGRIDESVALLERVRALDPLNRFVVVILAETYTAQGRADDALALMGRFVQQSGGSFELLATRFFIVLGTGEVAGIRRVWPANESAMDLTSRLVRLLEEPEQAIAAIRAEFDPATMPPLFASVAAPWAAYFGDEALAFEILAEGNVAAVALNVPRPVFAEARKTQAFRDFVRIVGLESYWRESGNWPDYCRPAGLDDLECF